MLLPIRCWRRARREVRFPVGFAESEVQQEGFDLLPSYVTLSRSFIIYLVASHLPGWVGMVIWRKDCTSLPRRKSIRGLLLCNRGSERYQKKIVCRMQLADGISEVKTSSSCAWGIFRRSAVFLVGSRAYFPLYCC